MYSFNATSDLRAIEILIGHKCFNLKPNVSFLTCDIALTGFWCELNARNFRMENEKPTFDLSLSHNLFPRLATEKLQELAKEIQ